MAFLLYVPVIHQGYLALFDRYPKETRLFLIGEGLINEFPLMAREMRRIDPKIIADLLRASFKTVEVVEAESLSQLASMDLVSSSDEEMRQLIKKYLPKTKVEYDTAFLRWDPKSVQALNEVNPDETISRADFDRKIMKIAKTEANKSSDSFRQVGAVIVRDGKILASSFNQRQPAPHAPYTDGDPRNFLPLGTDTQLKNTLHAEQAVVAEAAKKGIRVDGASLYATTFPCPDCAQVVANAGIKKCYYEEGYTSLDGDKLLRSYGVEIIKVI